MHPTDPVSSLMVRSLRTAQQSSPSGRATAHNIGELYVSLYTGRIVIPVDCSVLSIRCILVHVAVLRCASALPGAFCTFWRFFRLRGHFILYFGNVSKLCSHFGATLHLLPVSRALNHPIFRYANAIAYIACIVRYPGSHLDVHSGCFPVVFITSPVHSPSGSFC
ncbi:hypothetical protein KP509_19G070200 [Ceratopteris richardii]|uniref:Uncharacterized protein n=1 Tax=Ceratopteris richardii TaxID=49495 RepID=A0A8T2SM64_CERRI|nr:hypothetical protein KP509_19G070200 [Ceratopteris richardii]